MKNKFKVFGAAALSAVMLLGSATLYAGNEDRAGQAGATELLINPWARSSGWGGANSASMQGLEAMYMNVAGVSFTKRTEVMFAHTRWLVGSGTSINSFGLTQKIGEAGVLGLGIMSMGFGDISVTTVDQPEGTGSFFSPRYMNIGLSYAKTFSNSIHGGISVKVISQSIANATAQGFAFDAGIQYVTRLGKKDNPLTKDNLAFGIALRNVGPPMSFSGDGFSVRGLVSSTGTSLTLEQRSAKFEMPSLLNIGITYHWRMAEAHRISFAGTFTSNSFSKDQFRGGLEYGFKQYLALRGGYVYEKGQGNAETSTTAFTGPCAGATLELPFGKEKKGSFAVDYSWTASNPFQGNHSIGVRIAL